MVLTPFSALNFAQPTYSGYINDSSALTRVLSEQTPYANETRQDCATYMTGYSLTNLSTNATITSCSEIASGYGVSLTDFLNWNPSLNSSNPCVVEPNLQYCVQMYGTNATNITPYCTQYELAEPGVDCFNFTANYAIQPAPFSAWNPTVIM